MVARLDGGAIDLYSGRAEALTTGRASDDNYEHILHFGSPSIHRASAESASLAETPLRTIGASASEKGLVDQERLVEGGDPVTYPSIPVLVTLTIALMIAIFMIGLDTNIIGESRRLPYLSGSSRASAAASGREENNTPMVAVRDRYPQDHQPLPQPGRRRLVRVCIPFDPIVIAINIRETLFPVQHQVGLHRRTPHL